MSLSPSGYRAACLVGGLILNKGLHRLGLHFLAPAMDR